MYCGINPEGKRLYVAKLKAELHKYRSRIHSTLIFHHASNTPPKLYLELSAVTNGDLPSQQSF